MTVCMLAYVNWFLAFCSFLYWFRCRDPCRALLQCGHLCAERCGDDHTTKCKVPSRKQGSCGHAFSAPCHALSESLPCTKPCDKILSCDHLCAGTCGECMGGRLHAPCKSPCGRTLVCGHQCEEPCTRNCPPCAKPCENSCAHSRCPRR